MGAHKLVERN